jgi:metal-responsive CopG/Arc/MetJ family transcriptional regulator
MRTIATIDEAMLEHIDRLAGHRGDTPNRSKIIRAAVDEYLVRIDPTEKRNGSATCSDVIAGASSVRRRRS